MRTQTTHAYAHSTTHYYSRSVLSPFCTRFAHQPTALSPFCTRTYRRRRRLYLLNWHLFLHTAPRNCTRAGHTLPYCTRNYAISHKRVAGEFLQSVTSKARIQETLHPEKLHFHPLSQQWPISVLKQFAVVSELKLAILFLPAKINNFSPTVSCNCTPDCPCEGVCKGGENGCCPCVCQGCDGTCKCVDKCEDKSKCRCPSNCCTCTECGELFFIAITHRPISALVYYLAVGFKWVLRNPSFAHFLP